MTGWFFCRLGWAGMAGRLENSPMSSSAGEERANEENPLEQSSIARSCFDSLYSDLPSRSAELLSKSYRLDSQLRSPTLTYGEISYDDFLPVIKEAVNILGKNEFSYADLGSGTGKSLFAVSLNFACPKVLGIEIQQPLNEKAKEIIQLYKRKTEAGENLPTPRTPPNCVFSELGDFLCFSSLWTSCDLIFCCSTMFDIPLMRKIAQKAVELKKGAVIITLTDDLISCWEEKFDSPGEGQVEGDIRDIRESFRGNKENNQNQFLQIQTSKQLKNSWGNATANIHVRL